MGGVDLLFSRNRGLKPLSGRDKLLLLMRQLKGGVKMKKIQFCPVCGKTIYEEKSWQECPLWENLICMKHCFAGCKYHDDVMLRCYYRRYAAP